MSSKSRRSDRNAKHRPWSPLIPYQVPPEARANRVVAAFQNHIVTVFVKETESPHFKDPEGKPQRMAHLMLGWARGLRGTDDYFYRMKQRVKNELCGEHAEFVELGPGAWREVNFQHTHLWVLPQGASYPLGIVPTDIEDKMAQMAGGRENLVTKEELELFVVRTPVIDPPEGDPDEIVEVFASEEECNEAYDGVAMADGATSGIELIGRIPSEGVNIAWTDAAKAKMGKVLAKSQPMPSEQPETPELFYEPDHEMDEDGVEPDADDDAPASLEEHLAIGIIMEELASEREDSRVRQLREVTEEAIGRSLDTRDIAVRAAEKPRIIVP